MELREILKILQLEDTYLAAIEPNWDQSEASFPAEIPKFLTPAGYRKKFECTGLDASLLPVLDDISAKIVNNPALLHLAWHCYQSQFIYPNPSFAKWPWFENILGENCTVFYLLVLIAALPLTIRKYLPRVAWALEYCLIKFFLRLKCWSLKQIPISRL